MVKLSKIKPNPDNPRLIKDERFKKLVQSIKDFPQMMELRPIITDEKGMILGGNMRLKAIQELGMKEIPDSWVKKASDLSEEQKREFIIKDNIGFGDWEWETLANNWDAGQLEEWGLEIPGFAFKEAIEDDYEIPDEIKTDLVTGDLFEIGQHRLLCGDSTNADDVAKVMEGQKAELLFTSPPYSDIREYDGQADLSVEKLIQFIPAWFPFVSYQVINLGLKRKDNDLVQYWDDYIQKAKDCGYKFLSWNVWAKQNAGSVGNQSAFIPICHEWIFVFGTDFKNINRTVERKTEIKEDIKQRKVRQSDGSMKSSSVGVQMNLKEMESVFFCNPELGEIRSKHPATFPVKLPAEYISAITKENEIIAEPFCGSGTTMVAAHQLNRKCIGIEISPQYCQIIIERMLKLDPTLEIKRNGQPYSLQDNNTEKTPIHAES